MQVNGEAQNLTPTTYAGVIKIGRGDYVVDPYTCAKVRHDQPMMTACVTLRAILHTKGVSLLGSCNSLQPRPWTDFDAKYAKTRGSAQ